ncbi:copper resistance protein NlpE N-terminal domain-containing protein [Parabacteroides bouchesdurhonensis]|uniref:copper resistance protein NlpE N-terminal domain-containing protein n=1 Tax=Parabacteroides bouchesdurhonensis TaxID=1936995 RepID=UPI000E4DF5A4|nr:copper resistance protein NlpE N-terminal domain-containing protein [Parabacteroides bouchesdurhonensis]RHJ93562.1 copper resistance protein NlpE [Bacteroides sp. AM07-16]
MKKYFIAVAALGLLAACSGKQSQKNVPVEVEEESITVAEAVPVEAAPIIPSMKEKTAKPINMRDSLKTDPKKGAVIQKKYKGKVKAAKSDTKSSTAKAAPEVDYDLTMYYQQDDTNNGVYEMDAIYLQEDNGQNKTYTSTGKREVKKGTPKDANATVYALIPSDGSDIIYFLVDGNTLVLLDEELQPISGDVSYVLTEVQ